MEIRVTVSADGRVRAQRDDGAVSPTGNLRFDGLDADLIRVFERWLRERDRRWRETEIKVFGSLLHRALFGGDVWSWVERSMIGMATGDRLRLQLAFPATGQNRLSAVPWEYLSVPDRPGSAGRFLATDTRFILSRYIPLETVRRSLAPEERLRLLLVVSQPRNLPEVVAEPVVEAMNDLETRLPMQLGILDQPTAYALLAKVKEFRPHVLHFTGHGQYDEDAEQASVALLEVDGLARWVTDSGLSQLLHQAGTVPRVVLLHSCEGATVDDRASFAGMAPQLIRNGVQCVVAMQYAVTNSTAIGFTAAFYDGLADGLLVDEAVQQGRWVISGALSADENARLLGIPVIYLHSRDSVLIRQGVRHEGTQP